MTADHLMLCGLPGSGKTSVGAVLAQRWGWPFVDLDQLITQRTGKTIPEIFAAGEAGFREIEHYLFSQLDGLAEPTVVATGGGTLANDEAWLRAERLGRVVWLSVSPAVAAARLGQRGTADRPLLVDDSGRQSPERRLAELLHRRVTHYGAAVRVVDANNDVQMVAEQVEKALLHPEIVLRVQTSRHAYPIRVFLADEDLLATEIAAFVTTPPVVMIVDRQLKVAVTALAESLGRRGVAVNVLLVSGGESLKQLSSVEVMATRLAEMGIGRDGLLVAIGGGSVTDAVGFVAATYLRGIRWLSVPTTLLGMVDSAIGGKVGANLAGAKNLLGAFYPPLAVLSDLRWLQTLPAREIASGFAEMLKMAATHDADYFKELGHLPASWVETNSAPLVARAAAIKAAVVSEDEFESGLRRVLNFGHTFGHAFEAAASLTGLRHGEAVALGMLAMTELAIQEKVSSAAVLEALIPAIEAAGLPSDWRMYAKAAVPFIKHDKKRQGQLLTAVVVPEIGRFDWLDISPQKLEAFLVDQGTSSS